MSKAQTTTTYTLVVEADFHANVPSDRDELEDFAIAMIERLEHEAPELELEPVASVDFGKMIVTIRFAIGEAHRADMPARLTRAISILQGATESDDEPASQLHGLRAERELVCA